jgi:hypothetical protein
MTAIIANDTLEGLPTLGTQTGDFLGNLAPGLGKFILVIGVFAAIAGIIVAIVYIVKHKMKI